MSYSAYMAVTTTRSFASPASLSGVSRILPTSQLGMYPFRRISFRQIALKFVVYFVLPDLGVTISAFWSGVFALAINYSAYEAEIMRLGIQSVPVGQMEAPGEIGVHPPSRQCWRYQRERSYPPGGSDAAARPDTP